MKKVYILSILLVAGKLFGQTTEQNLFEVSKAFNKIYADKSENYIVAFDMGKYLDKAGIGSAIRITDTLFLQPDKTYKGKLFKVEESNSQLYILSLTEKKSKKYKLDKVDSLKNAYYNLNNAYYLGHYFAMTNRLNEKFELNHHSFRVGFYNWKNIINNKINYLEFRKFADKTIQEIEDSISVRQEYLTSLTNYLTTNIETISYSNFRDSISKIPAEFAYQSSYYKNVIEKISKTKPDYVVSLYKEFPQNRTLIEFAVEKDKTLRRSLKKINKSETVLAKKK
jgi:hypothetical protein